MREPPWHRKPKLPNAIWMSARQGMMPSCYQGTPLEMVEQMADEMRPGYGIDDTIDLIARFLADERGIRVRTPDIAPEDVRAEAFVQGLLDTGVAEKVPGA